MPGSESERELNQMAAEILELIKMASAARARGRSGQPEELSETEFLALDALVHDEPLAVGEVQKKIGVLPAQMSRLIRSLEDKNGRAFVTCRINPSDRRKIDVRITREGRTAHDAYAAIRLEFAKEVLQAFKGDQRRQFMDFMDAIRVRLGARLSGKSQAAARSVKGVRRKSS